MRFEVRARLSSPLAHAVRSLPGAVEVSAILLGVVACSSSSGSSGPVPDGGFGGTSRRSDAGHDAGDANHASSSGAQPPDGAATGPSPFVLQPGAGPVAGGPTSFYGIDDGVLYAVSMTGHAYPLAGGASEAITFSGAWSGFHGNGAAVVVGSALYIIGGGGDGIAGDWENADWDWVDLVGHTWNDGGNGPVIAHDLALAAYGSTIYATGGNLSEHSDSGSTDVYVLDTTTGTWSTGTSLPTPRAQHGAAIVGTTLLVAGGMCSGAACAGVTTADPVVVLGTCAILDVSSPTATWQGAPALPVAVENPALVATATRFYLMGGSTRDTYPPDYDGVVSWAPGESAWRSEGTLPAVDVTVALSTGTEVVLVAGPSGGVYTWTP
jgi:hypothetical protein